MSIHNQFESGNDIDRWITLGILEYFQSNKLIFIEWPKIIERILPNHIFNIYFSVKDENKREIRITK